MPHQPRKLWLMIGVLAVFVGACVTYKSDKLHKADRGVKANHAQHIKQQLACVDCHSTAKGEPAFPTHEVCTACHEIDKDLTPGKACELCHTKPGFAVEPYKKQISAENKFNHAAHTAKNVACDTCHIGPDLAPAGGKPLMAFCTSCHAKTDAKLTECSVCHTEISKNARPTMRGTTRIAHDSPDIWKRTHGRESKVDPAYCGLCHEKESYCEDCHRKTPPDDHSISWRREGHGQRASWNRDRCATCHEEDMCVRCHKRTAPTSHRAAWGRPINAHCSQCHFPPSTTKCSTCHETISHSTAMPSPHDLGIFPPKCGICHPGGLPNRAPHVTSGAVRCTVCH